MGSPFRAASLDFRAPLTPRDRLETEVNVRKVGRTSIGFYIEGYGVSEARGRCLCFTGELSVVFVKHEKMRATEIPADFREKLKDIGIIA